MTVARNFDSEIFNKLHNEDHLSLRKIAKMYNTTHEVVKKYLLKGGYSYKKRTYELKEDFFESLDSLEKFYFLGWIYSDGCVFNYENKGAGLSIKIQERDKYILEYFAKLMGSTRPLIVEEMDGRYYVDLTVGSKQIFNDLCKYGLHERKTFDLKYPFDIITDHRPFILGVFEGDGSISISSKNKKGTYTIAGTKDLLEGIREVFEKELNLNRVKLNKYKNTYLLQYSGIHSVLKIAEWMYSWDPSTYLIRKRDKFKQLIDIPKYGKNMIIFKCPECGKIDEFEKRNLSQLKKYKFKSKFCSLSCSGKFNRKYQMNGNKLTCEMEKAIEENIIREEKSHFKKTVMNNESSRIFTDKRSTPFI